MYGHVTCKTVLTKTSASKAGSRQVWVAESYRIGLRLVKSESPGIERNRPEVQPKAPRGWILLHCGVAANKGPKHRQQTAEGLEACFTHLMVIFRGKSLLPLRARGQYDILTLRSGRAPRPSGGRNRISAGMASIYGELGS